MRVCHLVHPNIPSETFLKALLALQPKNNKALDDE
jgi:hypothetical protein